MRIRRCRVAPSLGAPWSDAPSTVANFLQHHVNLLFFIQVPIQAAMCRLLTPRGPFNYAEYLVLIAYTAGMHVLFFTVVDVGGWYVFRPSASLARGAFVAMVPLAPLYLGFACSQFLPGSRWLSALKGVAAWLLAAAITQVAISFAANMGPFLPPH